MMVVLCKTVKRYSFESFNNRYILQGEHCMWTPGLAAPIEPPNFYLPKIRLKIFGYSNAVGELIEALLIAGNYWCAWGPF